MQDLAQRLATLDPQASAAVRVVAHFDSLAASRAGLQSIVRGAAALAGCPARLTDPARRVTVRVLADGAAAAPDADPDPAWPSAPVGAHGARLWLETTAAPGTVEAVILERAAAAATTVLERTRSRRPNDPASVELLLDPQAPQADRLTAARRLGLGPLARAVALPDGEARVISHPDAVPAGSRAGVGPAVPAVDLPRSWQLARLAFRLTADGTPEDPGPRVVHADEVGALILLVQAADAHPEHVADVPDLGALEHAAASAPWVLATLDAVASTASLRDAARTLRLHHSTLQDRLAQAQTTLGWDIRRPDGRLRLQLVLALRRTLRNPSRSR